MPNNSTYAKQRNALKKAAAAKGLHPLKAPQPVILDTLRAEARKRGLWNFFIERGGLTNLEYAPIAEMLGAFPLTNIAMNCSAPDTGNMEVLEKYGTPEQKDKWLTPLLNAEIRSTFIMTEPGVASSDATNISTRIDPHPNGKDYIINGHKWWISGKLVLLWIARFFLFFVLTFFLPFSLSFFQAPFARNAKSASCWAKLDSMVPAIPNNP